MIIWNTDCNAPCPGEIVDDESGQTLLVQTDWDYPCVAGTFGWSIRNVQRCPECSSVDVKPAPDFLGGAVAECQECGEQFDACHHENTDGTIDCPDCGVTATDFISAAGEWLRDNHGVTADDPGYFTPQPPYYQVRT